jgi:hypothetical protein
MESFADGADVSNANEFDDETVLCSSRDDVQLKQEKETCRPDSLSIRID